MPLITMPADTTTVQRCMIARDETDAMLQEHFAWVHAYCDDVMRRCGVQLQTMTLMLSVLG